MRRYQIIPLVLVGILSAGGGVVAGYAIGDNSPSLPVEANQMPVHYLASTSPPALREDWSPVQDLSEQYNSQPRYVLGTDHGFVAVFYAMDENQALKERTSTPESSLSPEERERLAGGIYIYTEEQLISALQDYGS